MPDIPETGEIIPDRAEFMQDVRDFLQHEPRDIHTAFAEFLRIDVANGDATEDTVKAYHRQVAYWVEWCELHGIEPQRARRRDVEAYRESLKDRGLAVATRQHKLSIVRRFYEAALKHNLIRENPAARVRGGKDLTPPEEKVKAQSQNAMVALAKAIPDDTLAGKRDRAIVALWAVHGLRRVETNRLDHESIEHDEDSPSITVAGKGSKQRRIYLRPDTYQCLLTYTDAKQAAGMSTTGALFVSHSNNSLGDRLDRRTFNKICDKYQNLAGIKRKGFGPHSLRAGHATGAIERGARIEHVRDELGHTDISTTSIYVDAVNRKRNNPANFIDVNFETSE